MKLRELLKVIPENYNITIMDNDPDNYSLMCSGNKKDVVVGYGRNAHMTEEQVLNLEVEAIHAGATTFLDRADMYGEDSTELCVRTQFLIEVIQG